MDAAITIDLLAQTWAEITKLCEGLDEANTLRPTDCPGWSVKDQLAHIIGSERAMRGESPPEIDITEPYIRNPLGDFNERWIAARREVAYAALLDEFRQVTTARIAEYRGLNAEGLAAEAMTPVGRSTVAGFIDLRLFDCFTHEQDLRRALRRPGRLDSQEAQRAARRMAEGLPRIVARTVGAPDGTRARFVVEGHAGGVWNVLVEDRRGRLGDDGGKPDTELIAGVETFLCLTAGRWAAERCLDDGGLRLAGNTDLGHRIAQRLALVP